MRTRTWFFYNNIQRINYTNKHFYYTFALIVVKVSVCCKAQTKFTKQEAKCSAKISHGNSSQSKFSVIKDVLFLFLSHTGSLGKNEMFSKHVESSVKNVYYSFGSYVRSLHYIFYTILIYSTHILFLF